MPNLNTTDTVNSQTKEATIRQMVRTFMWEVQTLPHAVQAQEDKCLGVADIKKIDGVETLTIDGKVIGHFIPNKKGLIRTPINTETKNS